MPMPDAEAGLPLTILLPMARPFTLAWFSERHLVARVAGAPAMGLVHAAHRRLRLAGHPFIIDLTPGAASLLITLDPTHRHPDEIVAAVDRELDAVASEAEPAIDSRRIVVVPVCHDPEFAPDLDAAAAHAGLSSHAFRDAFASVTFTVAFLGFMPGFAYLDGLPDALHVPRLAQPRASVPAGSVAIGGSTAGVYPFASPGGWRLIGRTPLAMFNPALEPPTLLATGDAVRFEPVTRDAFERLHASRKRPA